MAELSAKSRTSCRAWDVTRAHLCHCLLPLLLPQRGALLGSSVSLNRLQAHRVVGSVLGQASLRSLTNPYNYRYRFHLGEKKKITNPFFLQCCIIKCNSCLHFFFSHKILILYNFLHNVVCSFLFEAVSEEEIGTSERYWYLF